LNHFKIPFNHFRIPLLITIKHPKKSPHNITQNHCRTIPDLAMDGETLQHFAALHRRQGFILGQWHLARQAGCALYKDVFKADTIGKYGK